MEIQNKSCQRITCCGFSLIELSIVLVLLGLITGGIIAGKSLIHASELKSVIQEKTKFTTASNSFKQMYDKYPGDLNNATEYWGAENTDHATCIATPSTTQATCNGDGNGRIGDVSATRHERMRFWQHLVNAGLLEGQFSGVGEGSSQGATSNNVPESKYPNGLWYLTLNEYPNTTTVYFGKGPRGHGFYIGAPAVNFGPHTELFSPQEAWEIDKKQDDGHPVFGNTEAMRTIDCTTYDPLSSPLLQDAQYDLSEDSPKCAIMFLSF